MAPRLGPRQVEDNDPFLWDVEQVVAELCGANCPWAKDPAAFADRLRAEELDGRTLLTFQSTTSLDRLLNRLDFKTLRDESRFNEKVNELRLQSPSFAAWRFSLDRKQERVSGIIANQEDGNIEEDRLPYVPEEAPSPISQDARTPGTVSSSATPAIGQMAISGGSQSSAIGRRLLPTPFELKRPATHDNDIVTDAAEPPPKKSRVQPTNISVQTVTEQFVALPWERAPAWAYIGDGALTQEMLTSDSEPVTSLVLDYVDQVSSEEEFTVKPKRLPPGRRIAVAMVMRRLLIKNARNLVRIDEGEEVVSDFGVDEKDMILALSDLPSELDDDTRREIEDERLEAEELRLQADGIPQHKVQEILDQEIEAFTRLWETRKATKLKREAWSLWNQARKGKRNIMSEQSRSEIRALDERIAAYTSRILREGWQVESEVRAQALILEASVEDRLYQAWKLNVIECRVEPERERPLAPARPSLTPKKRPAAMEEVLTSSDEEDDTDFIVHDEDPAPMDISDAAADPSSDAASGQTPHAPEATNGDGGATQSSDDDSQRLRADSTTPVRTRHPPSPTAPPSQHSVPVIDLTLEPDSQPTEASTTDAVNGPSLKSLSSLSLITAHDAKFWSNQNDRWRLVLWVLAKMTFNRRKAVFVAVQTCSPLKVWKTYVTGFLNEPPQDYGTVGTWTEKELLCFDIARLFLTHLRCRVQAEKRLMPPTNNTMHKIRSNKEGFSLFCQWLRNKESIFPTADQIYRGHDNIPDSDEEIPADKELEEYGSPQKRKKQTKEVVQNRDALTLRQLAKERIKEQEARRQRLRSQLEGLGSSIHGDTRIIINESKDDEQELVYVNEDIAHSIKEHQIDGVRFLWNQIVLPPTLRQGCLLAHTMGLGKTMQVITFLVALAQASRDAKTATQIPEDLRNSQTLILCPAGLVNNWMDELCKWAPEDSLGPLVSLDSAATPFMREDILREWAADGGVLVLGYDMFKAFFRKDKTDDEGRLQYEELAALLLETPKIVVADEAHKLKAQNGVLNSLCSQFHTSGRIALTGSPLSNNTIEYYSMIHWVAPNFLGPLEEFKEIYVREIENGLARDSVASDKRLALRKLHALKTTVAPKVHRATIKVLSHDLPPKSEFVISVPPTKLQCDLYTLYINAMHDGGAGRSGAALTAAKDLVLLCNHPVCFGSKVRQVMQEIATGTANKASTFPTGIIDEANRLTNPHTNSTIQDPSYSAKVLYLCRILDVSRAIGDKVLVFSQSLPTLDYLQKIMETQDRRFCRLDGGSKINERQHQTRAFNEGQQDVYLISTKAGGVGLNIQGANRVVIFDSQWNPADDQQAVGRAYRLGQRKHVFVYYLMVAGTIEQELHNQAVFKGQLATRVVDQKNPISWGQRHGKYLMHIQHPNNETRAPNLEAFIGKDQILDILIREPPRTTRPEPQQLQISKLVSTDTFEEEDIDATLTLEERKEAEEAVRLDHLRRTDPPEHAKLMAEQQAHLAQQCQHPTQNGGKMTPIPPPTQPYSTTRPPHHIPGLNGPTTMAHNFGVGVASADGPRREHAPAAAESGPAPRESNSGVPGKSSGTDDASPVVAVANVPPPPMPMVGANTYFGRQSEVMSSTHSPGPATSASAAPAQAPPASPASVPAPAFTLGSSQSQPLDAIFQQKLTERLEAIPGIPGLAHGGIQHRARSLARSIQQVLEARGAGFLPDKVQWKLLTELLDNERFTTAMAYGLLTPKYVASAGRKVLQSRVDSLERLSHQSFMTQCNLKTKNKDPAV
ncbi:DNA repair protein-like protein [Emericellopsis cladophorae]|uniref:DNA repair protein-like protein n=1 Tax=Emericellopsis cladophorae TaxID=2686198 RepID=A0A9P9Y0H0_9HYPO|nr:DNA repair protein-like protein [Emericellopsis cladophorae]KAI6781090.1 DNA repair protein-like protein [Emericellopsis cladophorae]